MYMAFGKPMILVASTRYEVGRFDAVSWRRLNSNLRAIAAKQQNVIAANNRYDQEYIKHFTGIRDVKLIPSMCSYVAVKYRAERKGILIGPSKLSPGGKEILYGDSGLFPFLSTLQDSDLNFFPIREIYPTYTYEDIARHEAILLIPYQVSIMSLFEYYAMHVPIIAPSVELLVEWQIEYQLLNELSWNCARHNCGARSAIEPHQNSPHLGTDPNDIFNSTSLHHWLQFADFYQWPGIIYFDSWDDLISKLHDADLKNVSNTMKAHRAKQLADTENVWRSVLRRCSGSQNDPTRLANYRTDRQAWETNIIELFPELPTLAVTSPC